MSIASRLISVTGGKVGGLVVDFTTTVSVVKSLALDETNGYIYICWTDETIADHNSSVAKVSISDGSVSWVKNIAPQSGQDFEISSNATVVGSYLYITCRFGSSFADLGYMKLATSDGSFSACRAANGASNTSTTMDDSGYFYSVNKSGTENIATCENMVTGATVYSEDYEGSTTEYGDADLIFHNFYNDITHFGRYDSIYTFKTQLVEGNNTELDFGGSMRSLSQRFTAAACDASGNMFLGSGGTIAKYTTSNTIADSWTISGDGVGSIALSCQEATSGIIPLAGQTKVTLFDSTAGTARQITVGLGGVNSPRVSDEVAIDAAGNYAYFCITDASNNDNFSLIKYPISAALVRGVVKITNEAAVINPTGSPSITDDPVSTTITTQSFYDSGDDNLGYADYSSSNFTFSNATYSATAAEF